MTSMAEIADVRAKRHAVSKTSLQLKVNTIWRVLVVAALLLPSATWLIFGTVSDVGDGVYHYLAAHLAFSHPTILLDTWCKPLFTLLASPFAWLGFSGMLLFQALATGLSAGLVWRIGIGSEIRFPWVASLLLLLAPPVQRLYGILGSVSSSMTLAPRS